MGRLTTHVLDTARGLPAQGVLIQLNQSFNAKDWQTLKKVHTNADGRCSEALLEGEALMKGYYELVFHVGAYFTENAPYHPLSTPCFLNDIPIRFFINDPLAHYHIPLLVSPWSYSTYRGS